MKNAKQMWGWLLGPPLTESQNTPAGLYQLTQDRFKKGKNAKQMPRTVRRQS